MSEETKTTIANAYATTKGGIWKYFGAMMTEEKDGQQAVSFTRVLGLVMFGFCLYKWGMEMPLPSDAYTLLLVLIGVKGLEKGVSLWKAPAAAPAAPPTE